MTDLKPETLVELLAALGGPGAVTALTALMTLSEASKLDLIEHLHTSLPDNCVRCHGAKGGVRGNENRIKGVVLCDYCTAEVL